jgi:hypothetical protein
MPKNSSSTSSDNGPIALGDQTPPLASATPDREPPPPPPSSKGKDWRKNRDKKIAAKLADGEQS